VAKEEPMTKVRIADIGCRKAAVGCLHKVEAPPEQVQSPVIEVRLHQVEQKRNKDRSSYRPNCHVANWIEIVGRDGKLTREYG
jgi:hypothetical protein